MHGLARDATHGVGAGGRDTTAVVFESRIIRPVHTTPHNVTRVKLHVENGLSKESLDFLRAQPLVEDAQVVNQAGEVAGRTRSRESDPDSVLRLPIASTLSARCHHEPIYIELLAACAAAEGVHQMMPLTVGIVQARCVNAFLFVYAPPHVATTQVDVPIVLVALYDGENAAVGAGRLEPQRYGESGLGHVNQRFHVGVPIQYQGVAVFALLATRRTTGPNARAVMRRLAARPVLEGVGVAGVLKGQPYLGAAS